MSKQKIIIVTGPKGSGKSTYLKELINDDFDGVLTECIDRNLRKYQFRLIKTNEEFLCCYYDNGMKFNDESFGIVNDYLAPQPPKGGVLASLVIIDEIGWLELEGKGLYRGLTGVLNSKTIKKLYLSMRYDIYEKLIVKFGIVDYELVVLEN